MLGIFCAAFVFLHVCCRQGKMCVILGVSAFFAFMEVRRANKDGVDVMEPGIGEAEKNHDHSRALVTNPTFALEYYF